MNYQYTIEIHSKARTNTALCHRVTCDSLENPLIIFLQTKRSSTQHEQKRLASTCSNLMTILTIHADSEPMYWCVRRLNTMQLGIVYNKLSRQNMTELCKCLGLATHAVSTASCKLGTSPRQPSQLAGLTCCQFTMMVDKLLACIACRSEEHILRLTDLTQVS